MAYHARVEELSDTSSDPEEMDISAYAPPAKSSMSLMDPALVPSSSGDIDAPLQPIFQAPTSGQSSAEKERIKHWQCIYPLYFDARRSRAEGRRVGKSQAVENPLAREIVDATIALGLRVTFEPGKTHPKDWSNPGRVRVLLTEDGKSVSSTIKNKHHLFLSIADYLKSHPPTSETPLRLPIAGLPIKEPPPPPAAPRGWKVNTILPLHSPALSGGGISDNFLKDMMSEITGDPTGAGIGSTSSNSGEMKKKKDKKKGKGK